MDSCTIYSHFPRYKEVYEKLRKRYGAENLAIEGEEDHWEKITITGGRSVFLKKSVIEINARQRPQLRVSLHRGNDELTRNLRGMYAYFAKVEADKPELQQKALVKISTFNLELGFVARPWFSKRADHWEMLLELTEVLDGLLFIASHKLLRYAGNGNALLNGRGQLVLDVEGKSEVDDLEVSIDASLEGNQEAAKPEAVARRQRSHEILQQRGLPFFEKLPCLPSADVREMRPVEEIARRALCLALVAVKGEGLEQERVLEVMKQYELEPHLSPKEHSFIFGEAPAEHARTQHIWRYECYWTLLWALGYVEELHFPDRICDPAMAVQLMVEAQNAENFIQAAKPLSMESVLDESDLTYRLHWVVVDARLKSQDPPAGLDPGVIYERHYTLNWLINLRGEAWDDVRTDT